MDNLFPSPLQKIIIEYCHFPKSYLEEIKEKTAYIHNLHIVSIYKDIGYTYAHIINHPERGWIISGVITDAIRRYLVKKRKTRDRILNVGRVDYYQRVYCGY